MPSAKQGLVSALTLRGSALAVPWQCLGSALAVPQYGLSAACEARAPALEELLFSFKSRRGIIRKDSEFGLCSQVLPGVFGFCF